MSYLLAFSCATVHAAWRKREADSGGPRVASHGGDANMTMTFDTPVSSALVDDMYAAALGEQSWDTALDRLRNDMGQRLVTLFSFSHSTEVGAVNLAVGDDGAWAAACQKAYGDTFYLYDPAARFIRDWPAGRWYDDADWIPESRRASNVFYQEFLKPNALSGISGLFLHRGECDSAFLSMTGGTGSGGLTPRQKRAVESVLPHLSRALRLQSRLQQLEERAAIAESSLDAMPVPIWLIDDARVLLHANQAAMALIDQKTVPVVMGRFELSKHFTDRDWQAACAAGGMLLPGDGRAAMPVTIVPVPDSSRLSRLSRGKLHLMTAAGARRGQAKADRLRILFGLSVAESELAVALCCDGQTPKACADRRGVSLSTGRSQIKAIHAKTGVSRASQLMSMVLSL